MLFLNTLCGRFSKSCTLRHIRNVSTINIAMVGSGPAAFYCAQSLKRHLRKHDVCIDIFEKLPFPFGLIRYGVAPDHPEVKNCIHQFEKFVDTSKSGTVNFFGNVKIGRDISVRELLDCYNVVVCAYGADDEHSLSIGGRSNETNILSSRQFVGWYNGHPDFVNLSFDLQCTDTAIVVGHGNVALDVARMLLLPVNLLEKTDIAQHALDKLRHSTITKVIMVGRRGPAQIAFTIKELREMIKLPNVMSKFNVDDFTALDDVFLDKVPRPRKRLLDLITSTACNPPASNILHSGSKAWELRFFSTPVEVVRDESSKLVGMKVERNQLLGRVDPKATEKAKVVPLLPNQYDIVKGGLIISSIGYKSVNIDDDSLPFDYDRNVIMTSGEGRVTNVPGLYAAGWCARGPVGVLATTQVHATHLGRTIANDVTSLDSIGGKPGSVAIESTLKKRNISIIRWDDWKKIDLVEKSIGSRDGKERQKLISLNDVMNVL